MFTRASSAIMANSQEPDDLPHPQRHNRPRKKRWQYPVAYLLLALVSLANPVSHADPADQAPVKLNYQLLQSRPLKSPFFTQGLEIHEGQLLQSSGLYGKSKLVSRPLNDTAVTAGATWQHALNKQYFAEGLTVFNNTVYLLSWREQTLWRFDVATGKLLGRNTYQGEGWGLTHDQQHLIRSDGSDTLFFHDPETLDLKYRLQVTRNGQAVKNINELEFAQGLIWANIWFSSEIIAIDPASGAVKAVVNIAELAKRERARNPDPNAVANGIAFDSRNKSFWVTGKHWSQLYQLHIDTDALTRPLSKGQHP